MIDGDVVNLSGLSQSWRDIQLKDFDKTAVIWYVFNIASFLSAPVYWGVLKSSCNR